MTAGWLAQPHAARRALGAVLRVPDVRHANRCAVPGREDDGIEILRGIDAAEGAKQQLPLALLHRAARNLDVLSHHGIAHLADRQPIRAQLLDVDDDVNLAGTTSTEIDLADAVDGLDGAADLLVGQLRQRSQAHRRGRHDERKDGVGVGIDLGDHRRQQLRRRALDGPGHFFADVVRGIVEVPLEHEADGDPRLAFGDARLDLVDTRHAADRFLHRLDDRARDLVGAGTGELQLHAHGRRVGFREEIHAEIAEREQPEHDQRQHEHRRGHGPADAEFREHSSDLSESCYRVTVTRAPSDSVSTSVIATGSPSFTPLAISTRSPSRSPTCSSRIERRSPFTTNTRFTP